VRGHVGPPGPALSSGTHDWGAPAAAGTIRSVRTAMCSSLVHPDARSAAPSLQPPPPGRSRREGRSAARPPILFASRTGQPRVPHRLGNFNIKAGCARNVFSSRAVPPGDQGLRVGQPVCASRFDEIRRHLQCTGASGGADPPALLDSPRCCSAWPPKGGTRKTAPAVECLPLAELLSLSEQSNEPSPVHDGSGSILVGDPRSAIETCTRCLREGSELLDALQEHASVRSCGRRVIGPSDVAIGGNGLPLPRANNLVDVLAQHARRVDAVTEVPAYLVGWLRYYDPDPAPAPTKVSSLWEAFSRRVLRPWPLRDSTCVPPVHRSAAAPCHLM